MIDSSRSPRPLWKRTITVVLLIVFIVTFSWLIWVKELHHKNIHIRTVGIRIPAAVLVAPAPLLA